MIKFEVFLVLMDNHQGIQDLNIYSSMKLHLINFASNLMISS